MLLLATLVWPLAIAAGMAAVIRHSVTPGERGAEPNGWAGRDLTRPTLVVAVHPRCPCTRATLHELESILNRLGSRLAYVVLFYVPAGAGPEWTSSDAWHLAQKLAVEVRADVDGREARALGARTSGHAFLFAADGRLRFNGGITGARGHVGPNAGSEAVVMLVNHDAPHPVQSPVFGCPLNPSWR
jgi:hypothetical protein